MDHPDITVTAAKQPQLLLKSLFRLLQIPRPIRDTSHIIIEPNMELCNHVLAAALHAPPDGFSRPGGWHDHINQIDATAQCIVYDPLHLSIR